MYSLIANFLFFSIERSTATCLKLLINSGADSVVSVTDVPHRYNPYSVMRMERGYLKPFLRISERKNLRQAKPVFYARNGAAIYAFTYKCLKEKKSIYGDRILPYAMKEEESVDIDSLIDLKLADALLKGKRKRKKV